MEDANIGTEKVGTLFPKEISNLENVQKGGMVTKGKKKISSTKAKWLLKQKRQRKKQKRRENEQPAQSTSISSFLSESGMKWPSLSPYEPFGKSVVVDIENMEPNQRIISQKIISDVLFYGKLGKLEENSTFSVPAVPPFEHSIQYCNHQSQKPSYGYKITLAPTLTDAVATQPQFVTPVTTINSTSSNIQTGVVVTQPPTVTGGTIINFSSSNDITDAVAPQPPTVTPVTTAIKSTSSDAFSVSSESPYAFSIPYDIRQCKITCGNRYTIMPTSTNAAVTQLPATNCYTCQQ